MTNPLDEEKVTKLRRTERIEELELDQVVDLCLDACPMESLLDIGTGSGLFAEAFAEHGLTVQGVDADPDMVAAACSYLETAQFEVASAENLPFPDNAFDTCFMGLVLHETSEPVKALKEARRVAARLVAVLEWPYPQPDDHQAPGRRLQQSEIETMAHAAGFRDVRVHPLQNLVLYRMLK